MLSIFLGILTPWGCWPALSLDKSSVIVLIEDWYSFGGALGVGFAEGVTGCRGVGREGIDETGDCPIGGGVLVVGAGAEGVGAEP